MKKLPYHQLTTLIRQRIAIGMFRAGRLPTEGMYPGSIYLPTEGIRRVPWLPEVIRPDMQMVIETVSAEEARTAAQRYPAYHFRQWLPAEYFHTWKEEGTPDFLVAIDPLELSIEIRTAQETGRPIEIVDLRDPAAIERHPLPYGVAFHPMEILDHPDEIPSDQVYYVLCEDGEASLCFATVMKRFSFHNFYPVLGGYRALMQLPAAEQF